MSLKDRFQALFSNKRATISYQWEADHEGLNFFIDPDTTQLIQKGKADTWVMAQHIVLSMLAEQELVEIIPNGFIAPQKVVANLDAMSREALSLPSHWQGHMKGTFKSRTASKNFTFNLSLEIESGRYTQVYKTIGGLIQFTPTQCYTQTPEQELIFTALTQHQQSKKSEADNLRLIIALQEAQNKGLGLTLGHFDKLDVKAPESVSLVAELDEKGNLILTPTMGQKANNAQIKKVLGQLYQKDASVLRVDEEIILFDEKQLAAVYEILKNRVIPREKVKDFLATPSAFINASLIDLDTGFSARVHGATTFKHAYFGDTDDSGIDWFGGGGTNPTLLPISQLPKYINNKLELEEFKEQLNNAYSTHADVLDFKEQSFDISDQLEVESILKKIEQALEKGDLGGNENGGEGGDLDPPIEDETVTLVVDIDENDENIGFFIETEINNVLYPSDKLNWSNHARKPFDHQREGVRWIVGVASKENSSGCLLADDMGLGKTYMALSAIEHLYRLEASKDAKYDQKPCLIVAPLSVLQNWKDEVDKTFIHSPFSDIVILQSAGDISRYRVGGVETKQMLPEDDNIAEIRYALKVGKTYTNDRLDIPKRLIITTYQTLRDYQFSLCSVHWRMVVFDEAQNIKNPNTLQTRAAKGLHSDFNLLVTGTPVENSLADFWCLMDTAIAGHLGSFQDFRQTYMTPIIQAAGDEIDAIRSERGIALRKKAGSFMLRRIKEDNIDGLPTKTIFVGLETDKEDAWKYQESLTSYMQGKQLERYEAAVTANNESEANQSLVTLHRMRDISLHPYLADKGRLSIKSDNKQNIRDIFDTSEKLKSILVTLDNIKSQSDKCIIFCINKQLQLFLSIALHSIYQLTVHVINGDTKAVAKKKSSTRQSLISSFEKQEGFNIIIMSPIAAGVGLTVVGANHVIHLERHWNPAKEAQASDRVYRIGQTKPVSVYVPILHHRETESFDVNLHKLLSKKTLLKDAVVTPEQIVPTFGGITGEWQTEHRILGADLVNLSWEHFEALCVVLLAKKINASHYYLTASGADYGADGLLFAGNERHLLQCKHTKNEEYKGYKAIQEIYAAKPKYKENLKKEITKLIFISNAKSVSKSLRELATTYNVDVLNYKELDELLIVHTVTMKMVFICLNSQRYSLS